MIHAVCTVEQEVHCDTLQVGPGQTTGGKWDLHMKQKGELIHGYKGGCSRSP